MTKGSLSRVTGSLADTVLPSCNTHAASWDYQEKYMQLPSSRYGYLLDTTQVEFLCRLYSMLYDVTVDCTDVFHTRWKYTSATINGEILGSINSRSVSNIAIWNRK